MNRENVYSSLSTANSLVKDNNNMDEIRNNFLDSPLSEIESKIAKQLDLYKAYPHKLKLAVAACMLLEQTLDVLKGIDTSHFYDDMIERIDNVEKDVESFFSANKERIFQDGIIAENVNTNDSRLRELMAAIEQYTIEAEQRIKKLVVERDNMQLSEL